MGAGFFAAPEAEQHLTLIHETCHARLYLTSMRERAIETIRLQRLENARRDYAWQHRALRNRVADLCENDKYDTAFLFRTFNEEVLAERLLVKLQPSLVQQRVEMFRAMRESFEARGGVGRMIPELQSFGLLYEIARNDLGAALSMTDRDRDQFNRMATERHTDLQRYPNAGQLLAYRIALQEPKFPPPPALSVFDQLADMVMAVPIVR